MDIDVVNDIRNQLLDRREVECVFHGIHGGLSRSDSVEAVLKKLKVSGKNVYVISIRGGYGTRDVKGLFYIYESAEDAKKNLPAYILKRNTVAASAAEAAPSQLGKAKTKEAAESKAEAEVRKEPEPKKAGAEEAEAEPKEKPKEPSETPKE